MGGDNVLPSSLGLAVDTGAGEALDAGADAVGVTAGAKAAGPPGVAALAGAAVPRRLAANAEGKPDIVVATRPTASSRACAPRINDMGERGSDTWGCSCP